MTIKIKEKNIEVNSPQKTAKILQDILASESKTDREKEHFWGIYLDTRNVIKRIELISLGILNASIVHPRETFKPAILSSSASIIIAHNHPSGDPEPSEADIGLTKRLVKAGEIMGIDILDHIIIAKTKFFSFKKGKIL